MISTYLEKFENLVVSEVLIGFFEDFIVQVLESEWVHRFVETD